CDYLHVQIVNTYLEVLRIHMKLEGMGLTEVMESALHIDLIAMCTNLGISRHSSDIREVSKAAEVSLGPGVHNQQPVEKKKIKSLHIYIKGLLCVIPQKIHLNKKNLYILCTHSSELHELLS
uniref:Uncharacterized protein n=1 Tax=Xenopus tropicalis TaxID=8364 RepID=A0A803K1Q2_XENTR